jgi:hypothetical protein
MHIFPPNTNTILIILLKHVAIKKKREIPVIQSSRPEPDYNHGLCRRLRPHPWIIKKSLFLFVSTFLAFLVFRKTSCAKTILKNVKVLLQGKLKNCIQSPRFYEVKFLACKASQQKNPLP